MEPLISVFTPTYNRGYCLGNLYESLLRQTDKRFQWIIVDDGSTDNTKSIVEEWIKQDLIPIIYYYQENQGKMAAHNKGVDLCNTDYFICVDSDDYITNDAVQILNQEIINKNIADDCYSGLILRKAIFSNNKKVISNTHLVFDSVRTTLWNLYNKYNYIGETALLYKTKILRNFLFPLFENEKFISESYIYNKIDDHYDMIFVNKEIMHCEYMNDGYSVNINKVLRMNPNGFILFFNDMCKRVKGLRRKAGYMKMTVLSLLIAKKNILSLFTKTSYPLLALAVLPFSLYIYIRLLLSNWTYKCY